MVWGFVLLARYDQTPGASRPLEASLVGTGLQPEPGKALLVAVLHPKCACSRATMAELAKILSHAQGKCSATALFYRPAGEAIEWVQSDLWKTAKQLGCETRLDEDGKIAERLGVFTSGHILVFDAQGTLRFSGGITASRGHEGDNLGEEAVLAILRGEHPERAQQPVFGCGVKTAAEPGASLPGTL
jgi:hypothetical protein